MVSIVKNTRTETTELSYILRGIPADLWRTVKAKAALDGISVRDLVLGMLREYTK